MKYAQSFFLIFASIFMLVSFDVSANNAESVRGWLWGGTEEVSGLTTGLGWISLNSVNCDADEDGQSDGSLGCPSLGETVADYGVHVPPRNGDLNGYAWSENLGWISFQPTDLAGCPSAPCSAYRRDDEIYGWARIITIRDAGSNAGGYDGWIKLHAVFGDPVSYGLSIDTVASPNEINGYMWSDEFGWIRAVDVQIAASESLIVCPAASVVSITGTFQLRAYHRPGERILSCIDVLATDLDVTSDASTSWVSNNSGLLTVGATGLVTGQATGGPVDVTASYLTESAVGFVSVNAQTSTCGDGTIQASEVCDQGTGGNGSCVTGTLFDHDSNSATADVTCSSSCQINICQCVL